MVEYAYANKAIGTLNAMKKEILASLDAMSQNNRKEILNSLPNSWRHIKNNSARQVQAVLRRGEIKSKREYRLVLEEVEKSYDDPDRSEEVKSLNTLLAAFEKKHPKGP
jgi:hypothetical protein